MIRKTVNQRTKIIACATAIEEIVFETDANIASKRIIGYRKRKEDSTFCRVLFVITIGAVRLISSVQAPVTAVADLADRIGGHKAHVRLPLGVRGVAVDAVSRPGISRLPTL